MNVVSAQNASSFTSRPFLRYAAKQVRRIIGEIPLSDTAAGEDTHMRRHSFGVVAGLTAWNYAAAITARKLGPALVAGNTLALLRHENTPRSGLALTKLAEIVGLSRGVFNVLTGRGAKTAPTALTAICASRQLT